MGWEWGRIWAALQSLTAFLACLCLGLHLLPLPAKPTLGLSGEELRTDGFRVLFKVQAEPRERNIGEKVGEVGRKQAGGSRVKALSKPSEIPPGSYITWAQGKPKDSACHQPRAGRGSLTSSVLLQGSLC